MNFSKTTLYSVQVLKYMADNQTEKHTASTLSKILGIPYQYLRYVMTSLCQSGFISGRVGRNGGFILNKNAEEISIADIIESCEGLDNMQKCIIGNDNCTYNGQCSLHEYWAETRNEIIQRLKTTNLRNFKF